MAAWGFPSSWKGGFPVAISMMVQPRAQISAGLPYPRGPWSMISGAMYCRVPVAEYIRRSLKSKHTRVHNVIWEAYKYALGDSPVNVSVHGLIPASLLEVPKSDILSTPLYVFIKTLSPWWDKKNVMQSMPRDEKNAAKMFRLMNLKAMAALWCIHTLMSLWTIWLSWRYFSPSRICLV